MSHNTIFPLSVKDKYRANDIVDWLLTFEGKQIVQNSIRITGTVRVDTDANIVANFFIHSITLKKQVLFLICGQETAAQANSSDSKIFFLYSSHWISELLFPFVFNLLETPGQNHWEKAPGRVQ